MNNASIPPEVVILHTASDRAVSAHIHDLLKDRWRVWSFSEAPSQQWTADVEQHISNAAITIFIWSNESIRSESEVRNELLYAKRKNKPRLHVCVDDSDLPIHASGEPTLNHHRDINTPDFAESLHNNVSNLATPAPNRSDRIVFPRSGKSVALPCFARSVSSFETLRQPTDALIALNLHPSRDPILVSAYDLSRANTTSQHHINTYIEQLSASRHDEPGTVLFLDSGNYEASRRRNLPQQGADEPVAWTVEEFQQTVRQWNLFDVLFSFDDPHHSGTEKEMARRVIELFQLTCDAARETQDVVPIIHAVPSPERNVNLNKLKYVITAVVSELAPTMVAIPEREIGDGILERMKNTAAIRQHLDSLDGKVFLHLLGTGNPISIAALSASGADSFDGLEWCRVAAEPGTGRLFHAQHGDFFSEEILRLSDHPRVAQMVDDEEFYMRLLVQNVEVYDEWMARLQSNIRWYGPNGALSTVGDEGIRQKLEGAL